MLNFLVIRYRFLVSVGLLVFGCIVVGNSQVTDARDNESEIEFDEYDDNNNIPVRVNLIDANFSLHIPTGRFSDKMDRSVYYGYSVSFLRQLKVEQPAFVGVELHQSFLGSLMRNYEQLVEDEFIFIDGRMSASTLGVNIIGKYYPNIKFGRIEPYAEVHFGGKWLFSYLSESGFFSNDEEYSSFEFIDSDFVLGYGGALGMQVFINDNIYFNIKSTYQVSNSAQFYKRIENDPSIFPLLPIDGFEIVNTATNNLRLDIGFTFVY